MTAEEYIINKETGSNEEWILFSEVEKLMLDYAKLKCEELLRIISEKGLLKNKLDAYEILGAVDLDSFIV